MKHSLFIIVAAVALGLANHARAQSGAASCAVPAVLPSQPSATAQVASFNGQWFPTGGQNATFSATLWREACPSNPATSIIYARYTPTLGSPLICQLNYSLFQNGIQYTNLQFLDPSGANFCAPLTTPMTLVVGSIGAPAFDANQAFVLVYQGAAPGLNGSNASVDLAAAGTPPSLIVPTVGLWWNPAESGSGYALDYKHGVLVVTVYSYTTGGAPIWYLASGPMSGNTFTSTLDKYQNGQCIACSYRPATINGNDGAIGITFTSSTTATMSLPGGRSFQVVPQPF
jgi:hypothetical protein